jgi:carbon monoxide dehydrogenase subunit G
MLMEGKFTLKAPIQKVWDALLEPKTLVSCIPGAEKIERIDEKTYECVVKQKVGPISARFKFKSVITKLDPPTHMEIEGEGEDIGKAGHFVQKSVINLGETSEGEVQVSYRTDVNIVGKLAMFGDWIMRTKAKKIEEEFTIALQEKLKGMG